MSAERRRRIEQLFNWASDVLKSEVEREMEEWAEGAIVSGSTLKEALDNYNAGNPVSQVADEATKRFLVAPSTARNYGEVILRTLTDQIRPSVQKRLEDNWAQIMERKAKSEVKRRAFEEVKAMARASPEGVSFDDLVSHLIRMGINSEEAVGFVRVAYKLGWIYEVRSGWYKAS